MFQLVLKDLQVGPLPSSMRSICPDNPTSLDADSHLVPDSRTVVLVREPLLGEWRWFVDPKICSINSHLAGSQLRPERARPESIFKFDLDMQAAKSRC